MSRAEQQRRRQNRKRRREWDHRKGLTGSAGGFSGRIVQLHSYTITNRKLSSAEYEYPALDEVLEGSHADLFEQVHTDQAAAIPRLCELLKRFPDSRMLMNWLTIAYGVVGEDEKANRLIRRNYELHPTYLFARIAYATLLMDEDKVSEAAEVMEHKWDLGAHYPRRSMFHVTEFLAISQLSFRYFIVTGDTEAARSLYAAFKEWDPEHLLTSHMQKVLEGSTLLRLMRRLFTGRRGHEKTG